MDFLVHGEAKRLIDQIESHGAPSPKLNVKGLADAAVKAEMTRELTKLEAEAEEKVRRIVRDELKDNLTNIHKRIDKIEMRIGSRGGLIAMSQLVQNNAADLVDLRRRIYTMGADACALTNEVKDIHKRIDGLIGDFSSVQRDYGGQLFKLQGLPGRVSKLETEKSHADACALTNALPRWFMSSVNDIKADKAPGTVDGVAVPKGNPS